MDSDISHFRNFKDSLPTISNFAYCFPLLLSLFISLPTLPVLAMFVLAITSGSWHIMELRAQYEHKGRVWRGYPAYIHRRLDVWSIYLVFSVIAAEHLFIYLGFLGYLIFPIVLLFEYVMSNHDRFTVIGTIAAIAILTSFLTLPTIQVIIAIILFGLAIKIAEEAFPNGQYRHSLWHLITSIAITLLFI